MQLKRHIFQPTKDGHIFKIVSMFMFLLGISLWIPAISVINIYGSWGIQICVLIITILLFLLVISALSTKQGLQINFWREWLVFHSTFMLAAIISTVFSSVGVTRSLQSFATETIGLIFSGVVTWWLCKNTSYTYTFLYGYRLAGILSAIYAIYQTVGLRYHLPYAYIKLNNPSFSILDQGSAEYLLRAFGLTPEPSVLASLLIPLIGMLNVDILVYGGIKYYVVWIIVLLGFLSTSSQSTAVLPIYLVFVILFTLTLLKRPRKLSSIDIIALICIGLGGIILVTTNSSVVQVLNRLMDLNKNESFFWRLGDFQVAMEMLILKPFTGWGLGANTEVAPIIRASMGLAGASGASSTLIRTIAEQGILEFFILIIGCICIVPLRIPKSYSQDQVALIGYHIAWIVSLVISMVLFIGYRNLYHMWLLVPLGLSLRTIILRIREHKVLQQVSSTKMTKVKTQSLITSI